MNTSGAEVKVLLMAGGEGRRLGDLTSSTPKPMLPVNGKPVLHHMLEHLRDQGVRHVFLSVRHLSHVIDSYFGDGHRLGIRIDYLVERRPLNTAGALGLLPSLSHPLLVVNGDIVARIPVAALAEYHKDNQAAMTIGCAEQRVQVPYGVVEGRWPDLTSVHEKPEVIVPVIAGVYMIAPDVVAGIPAESALAMPQLIETLLHQRRKVVGFALPGPWLDMGSPDTYACAGEVAASVRGRVIAEPRSEAAAIAARLAPSVREVISLGAVS